MNRLTPDELRAVHRRIFVDGVSIDESVDLLESLHPDDRRAVISHKLMFDRFNKWRAQEGEEKKAKPGAMSHQANWPVYQFACRYYAMRKRSDPECPPGKAAGAVRKHCLKYKDRFKHAPDKCRYKHVPSQKSIKAALKKYA